MERQIFDWESWEQIGDCEYQFENCILLVNVGEFNKGDTFDLISIDWQTGKMTIYDCEEETFDLLLTVHS